MPTNLHLITKALSHLRFKRLNRDMVGTKKEIPLGSTSLEEVRGYAEATQDNPDLYTEDSILPPLFLSRLIHPALIDTILDPQLKMNILKMVHGELEIKWYSPIFIKDQLVLSMEVKEIIETKAGELLRLSFLILKDTKIAAEAISGLLIRNPKGERSKKREEDPYGFIEGIEIQTEADQAIRYAKASLDNNPIHTNTLFAKVAGLKGPILHGVCIFAIACNKLTDRFVSGERRRLVGMSGRFAYPVYPGERLILNCYKGSSEREILFELRNSENQTNIKSGRFEFK